MSVSIPERFRRRRASVPFDRVSIGYAGISLVPLDELEPAQNGYGVVLEESQTDWRHEWIVIGNEERCGDPIFIDSDDDEYPVYTAAHGIGEWTPQLVAFTFRHFVEVLQQLQVFSRGRANPAQLQRHPVTHEEGEKFIDFIRRTSPEVDFTFWRGLYETEN